jgi:hypothetical protein
MSLSSQTPSKILFIDIAKHYTTCDRVTRMFFPRLSPGQAIVFSKITFGMTIQGGFPSRWAKTRSLLAQTVEICLRRMA